MRRAESHDTGTGPHRAGPGVPLSPSLLVARLPASAVDALIGAFAAWQGLALACVALEASFGTLVLLSPLAVCGLALPLWTRPWDAEVGNDAPAAPVAGGLVGLALAVAAAAAYTDGQLGLFWTAMGVLPLLAVLVAPRQPLAAGPPPDLSAGPLDWAALVATGAAAAALTLWIKQTDPDDGFYLTVAIGHLQNPGLALLSFDTVHGDTTVPIQQVLYRSETFEVFVAWVAKLSGYDPRSAYWLGVPAFFAACSALAHWVVARAFAPRLAWLATPVGFAVLCLWGDGKDAIGKYGFCRLYQGKSVFVTVMAPLVLYAGYRFVTAPSRRSWARLMLVQLAATVFTTTALVMAPLAAGLTVLAGLERRRPDVAAAGLASSGPTLVVLVWMAIELRRAGGLVEDGHMEAITTSLGAYHGGLALLGLGLAALALRMQSQPGGVFLARYGVASVLVVLNGATPAMLGSNVAELLNWRSFWSVPLAPILAVAVAGGLGAGVAAVRERTAPHLAVAAVAAGLAYAFWQGPSAIDGRGVGRDWMAWKVSHALMQEADRIVALTSPDDVVAAPPILGQYVILRPVRPKVVGVWYRWTASLRRHWGKDESDQRIRVVKYARGHDKGPPPLADLDAQCVRVLVTDRAVRRRPNGTAGLDGLGFVRRNGRAYDVWVRERADLPAFCAPP